VTRSAVKKARRFALLSIPAVLVLAAAVAILTAGKRTMQDVPLEVLEIEPMASGHRSLRLTRAVAWEDFGPYAESVVRALDGRILSRADSPVERVWSVQIGEGKYWLSFDDFALGVSLDSCDSVADAHIEDIRGRLMKLAAAPRRAGVNDGR
jgi:uncharacterized protein DUF3630